MKPHLSFSDVPSRTADCLLGRSSQLLVMQFLNHNVLYLREGGVWELPIVMKCIGNVAKAVAVVWKARRVVKETADVIKAYLNTQGGGDDDSDGGGGGGVRASSVSAPDFL